MKGVRTGAWSTLRTRLAEKGLTVADLHEMLQIAFPVNIKSLYRLTGTGPVQKIDLGIVRAICAALKVEIGDLIQFEKPKSYMRG
jgi:DNA-binding Xre family transcriptional regulator